nr:uncharacterized protein LOC102446654 [Pelodiscus sinensis]|eukprot:XP_006114414.1 uncharacterized protein LOC102446654 [Pelodiscus sinensis]
MWKQRLERDRGETWESTAYCCYPTEWGKGENSRAIVSQGVTPSQPIVLVRPEVSGLEPRGQGGGAGLALAKKICSLNLKGQNCNGVGPEKGPDGECQYTPEIGLFLLLMLILVTTVVLLQRLVKVYNGRELMETPCNLSGNVPSDRLDVKGHCDFDISWLMLVTDLGTSYRTRKVPARRCCMIRETEARHHFVFMDKCKNAYTIWDENTCIHTVLIVVQRVARAGLDKFTISFSSGQNHLTHMGILLQRQIQLVLGFTKFYLGILRQCKDVVVAITDLAVTKPILGKLGSRTLTQLCTVVSNIG